jgi:hypothetical protein
LSPCNGRFRGPPPSSFHRMVAAAVEGDRDALTLLLGDERLDDLAGRHRMGAALFVGAKKLGLEGPAVDRCHAICLATAAQWMRLQAVLARAGSALDAADVPWMPLKGLDTAERFFPRPELRLSSDIDVLVPAGRLDEAMGALERAGWAFDSTPLLAAYQRDEGYNWRARGPHGESLELHYRLWGMVPDSVVEGCWQSAVASPDLGTRGFRLAPPMAFLISSVHSWIHAGEPQFIYWWEIKLIADRLGSGDEVAAAARQHGLQFPVGLAAEWVGRLWDHELCLGLARRLLDDIRLPERVALGRVRRRGIESMTLELLYIARLLAGRPSRMGWRSVLRRVWPHAGTVESTTPPGLPWWRRRIVATSRNLGLFRN